MCGTKDNQKIIEQKGMGRKILNKHEHFQLVVFSKLPAGGHLNLQGTSGVIWRFSTTSSTSKGDLILLGIVTGPVELAPKVPTIFFD